MDDEMQTHAEIHTSELERGTYLETAVVKDDNKQEKSANITGQSPQWVQPSDWLVKCDKCDDEYWSPVNLRRHAWIKHSKPKNVKVIETDAEKLSVYWDKTVAEQIKLEKTSSLQSKVESLVSRMSSEKLALEDLCLDDISKPVGDLLQGTHPLHLLYQSAHLLKDLVSYGNFPNAFSLLTALHQLSERNSLQATRAPEMQKAMFGDDIKGVALQKENLLPSFAFLVEHYLVKAFDDANEESERISLLLLANEEDPQPKSQENPSSSKRRKKKKADRKAKADQEGENKAKDDDSNAQPSSVRSPLLSNVALDAQQKILVIDPKMTLILDDPNLPSSFHDTRTKPSHEQQATPNPESQSYRSSERDDRESQAPSCKTSELGQSIAASYTAAQDLDIAQTLILLSQSITRSHSPAQTSDITQPSSTCVVAQPSSLSAPALGDSPVPTLSAPLEAKVPDAPASLSAPALGDSPVPTADAPLEAKFPDAPPDLMAQGISCVPRLTLSPVASPNLVLNLQSSSHDMSTKPEATSREQQVTANPASHSYESIQRNRSKWQAPPRKTSQRGQSIAASHAAAHTAQPSYTRSRSISASYAASQKRIITQPGSAREAGDFAHPRVSASDATVEAKTPDARTIQRKSQAPPHKTIQQGQSIAASHAAAHTHAIAQPSYTRSRSIAASYAASQKRNITQPASAREAGDFAHPRVSVSDVTVEAKTPDAPANQGTSGLPSSTLSTGGLNKASASKISNKPSASSTRKIRQQSKPPSQPRAPVPSNAPNRSIVAQDPQPVQVPTQSYAHQTPSNAKHPICKFFWWKGRSKVPQSQVNRPVSRSEEVVQPASTSGAYAEARPAVGRLRLVPWHERFKAVIATRNCFSVALPAVNRIRLNPWRERYKAAITTGDYTTVEQYNDELDRMP